MTKIRFQLSQIVLALVVAFGAITFTACGEGGSKMSQNASKAPKIRLDGANIYAVSQDDDTIIKGVTVSGRNGKCGTQTVIKETGYYWERPSYYDSMESCLSDERNKGTCALILNGKKLDYNRQKYIYSVYRDSCPPKNGVWYVKLDTNFGTFNYELRSNR